MESCICSKCGFPSPISHFKYKVKGLEETRTQCKTCVNQYNKDWRLINRINNKKDTKIFQHVGVSAEARRRSYRALLDNLFVSDNYVIKVLGLRTSSKYKFTKLEIERQREKILDLRETQRIDAELKSQGFSPVYTLDGSPRKRRCEITPKVRENRAFTLRHKATYGICAICKQRLPNSAFGTARSSAGSIVKRYACKECEREKQRKSVINMDDNFVRSRAKELFNYNSVKELSAEIIETTRLYIIAQRNLKESNYDTQKH